MALQASQKESWSLELAVMTDVSVNIGSPGGRSSFAKRPNCLIILVLPPLMPSSASVRAGSSVTRTSSLGATAERRSFRNARHSSDARSGS